MAAPKPGGLVPGTHTVEGETAPDVPLTPTRTCVRIR